MSSSSGPKRRVRGRAAPTIIPHTTINKTAEAQSAAIFALETMGGEREVVAEERTTPRRSSVTQSSTGNRTEDGDNDDNGHDNDAGSNYSYSSDASGGGDHSQTSNRTRARKHKSRRTPHHVIEKNRRNKERDVFDELRGHTGVCDKKGSKLEILRRTVSLINDLHARIAQLEAVATQPAMPAHPTMPTEAIQFVTPEQTGTPGESATPGRLNVLARASEQASAQLVASTRPERSRSHTISFLLGPSDDNDDIILSSPLTKPMTQRVESFGLVCEGHEHTGGNGYDATYISSTMPNYPCISRHLSGP